MLHDRVCQFHLHAARTGYPSRFQNKFVHAIAIDISDLAFISPRTIQTKDQRIIGWSELPLDVLWDWNQAPDLPLKNPYGNTYFTDQLCVGKISGRRPRNRSSPP